MKRRSLIRTARAVLVLALAAGGGAGAASAQPVVVSASPSAPTTPNQVHAAGLSPTEVHLEWSPAAEPARPGQSLSLLEGYRVLRDGAQIATVSAGILSYQDSGLTPDTTYAYQIVAVNADGELSQAAAASATTLPVLPPVTGTSIHPRLVSPSDTIDRLAAGGPEWDAYRSTCDARLSTLIAPSYAGWDWRDAAVNYGICYQVARRSDAVLAARYARKGLAMLAVLARHHNGGTPDARVQPLGQGDGASLAFALPFAPMDPAAVEVFLVPTREVAVVRTADPSDPINLFAPIMKVSNSSGGPADYAPGDYRIVYRDALGTYRLGWPGTAPATGSTYYMSVADGELLAAPAGTWSLSGTSLTFSVAPSAAQTVMVRYLGANYEQTGNGLGGVNAVQPDGPGYPMRTFNVGLALGYDLLHDVPEFGSALKAEFYQVLNGQLDWYTAGGYENNGDIGNYFIRGYLTGAFATAYATDGENPRAPELKALANSLMLRTYAGMARYLPGGYGPQGQYANGTTIDVLQILSLYQDVTGLDLLSRLSWTDNVVAATIHGTKPGRTTFYDGGDWSDLPAVPLTGALSAFLQYRPTHEAAPFARKLLGEVGQAPAGPVADYRQSYPLSYLAKVSGPMYARSGWDDDAAWMSLAAGRIATDHQHQDQGHLTINRGGDRLLVDAGGYDFANSIYHNTFLIDDRGAGDVSVYPPSQAWWGIQAQLVKFAQGAAFAYGQADFGDAYVNNSRTNNSVRRALRSVLFLHPDVFVVFDQVQTARPDVKKIFNLNFGGTLTTAGGIHSTTVGDSKLFLQTVLPFETTPVIAPLAGDGIVSTNYQETRTGSFDDTFLHVFQVADASAGTMSQGKLMRSVDALAQGVEVAAGGQLWVALFAARDRALGGALQYAVPTAGAHRHLVNDLLPTNHYVVSVTDLQGTVSRTLALASDRNGTLSFESDAGEAAFQVTPGTTPPATVPPIVGDPNAPAYTPPVPVPTPAEVPLGTFPSSQAGRYVALVSPTNGETFTGPLSLRLVAAGFDPLVFVNSPIQGRGTNAAKVQFYLDDTLLLEQQGGDAEYDIFKGYVSGLAVAPGPHQIRARATFVNPGLHLDSEPFTILVQAPTYAQTVELTSDVVLSGDDSYQLVGSAAGRIRLNGNGHRIVSAGTSGGLTLKFVDVFDLGGVDLAEPGLDVVTTGSVAIEDAVFERGNSLRLRLDGAATASIERNVFRSNLRMPIGQQPVPPSTVPVLTVSGSSTAPKTFAGNNVAAGPVVFDQASHWTIGGSTDAGSNVLVGPRAALELADCQEMTVRGNFVHHVYYGGWSQGQLLELHGTSPLLAEHNVLMDSSWPVRGLSGEFRYNLVLEAGHEWLVPGEAAYVHHNVFVGGDNDRGGITGQYDLAGVRIENNTFDGQSGSRMRAGVSWLAGSATLKSNLFFHVPAEAVAAVETAGGLLDADFNAFSNGVAANYSDGRTPANDLLGGAPAHPKLHGPLPTAAFDLDEAAVWKRELPVSAILATYRSRYSPTQASPLLEAGDPAGGVGNDIGAIGGGTVNAADRFGSFGDPNWTPPPTPATPQNQAPTVAITQPGTGSTFTAPASVSVTAATADPDGNVVRVDFLLNGSVVGSDTAAPFGASLSGLGAGSYSLAARATDDSGAVTASAPVAITVNVNSDPSNPPTTVGTYGENLFGDPGFETGLSGFWAQNSADLLERVTDSPIAESASLRMTVNGGWDNFWSSVLVEGSNLTYGNSLKVEARVRAETASSNTRLSLCAALYYQSGEWAAAAPCAVSSGVVGSVETLTSTLVIDPTRPLRLLHLYLKSEGPGPVVYSLDDVSMVLAAPGESQPEDPSDPPAPPAPPAAVYEQNLVADPGFEAGVSAFQAQNSADVITQATANPISGSASLQMVVNGGWDNFWMWRTVEGTNLEHGGQLTVSAKVRAETPASGTPLRLCAALYYQSGDWAEAPACGYASGVQGAVDTLTSSLTIDPASPLRVLYFYLKSDGPGGVTYTVDDVAIVLSQYGYGHNLVDDPGFESGVAAFSAQNPADVVSQVTSSPISGAASLQLVANGGWDNFWMWRTVEGTNLTRGGSLTVSAKVRAEAPAAGTPLRLCAALYYQSGDWAEAPSCGYSSGTAGEVETLSSVLTLDPAQPLRVLYFYLKSDGPGGVTYTVDDVSIVLSDPS